MLAYRVFTYDAGAGRGTPGHPEYVHLPGQGRGRWDNPQRYAGWYLAASPDGAIAEVAGGFDVWTEGIFTAGGHGRLPRALATFQLPDNVAIFDLDNGTNLSTVDMRPSDVVKRNRPFTQQRAAKIFDDGSWDGLSWWSYHRPHWTNIFLWQRPDSPTSCKAVKVEPLNLAHHAVIEAAAALGAGLG